MSRNRRFLHANSTPDWPLPEGGKAVVVATTSTKLLVTQLDEETLDNKTDSVGPFQDSELNGL